MSEKLIYADDILKYTVLAGEIRNQYMEVIPAYFLREAPAVDAVAVVRCKDCKYWGTPTENQEAICRHWSSYYGSIRTKNDQYCSYGERSGEKE